jgi:low temperature requirement protein LtrA
LTDVAAPEELEPGSPEPSRAEEEKRTGYIELFFDLVFVFAFTQVTALVLEDTSAAGFARAALIFALVWWAWAAYAWLTDAIDVENVATRLFIFGAMLGAFFIAIALPDAYTDEGAWFAVAYFVVRVLHIALYVWGVRDDPTQRAGVLRLTPWFLVAPTVALAGGFVDDPWRTTLWTVSLAIDVVGTLYAARAGFRVKASHFAERHALIVIIALGESIVAVGLAAVELERDALFALAVAVSLAGAAAAWWAYFDFTQLAAERALQAADEARRGPLARDLYTFFHYPIVLGIVFLAVASKKTLGGPGEPLADGGRAALALGFSLFLLGFVLSRYRVRRRIAWERVGAALVVVAAVLLFEDADALLLLAVSVLALVAALAVEAVRFRDFRSALASR